MDISVGSLYKYIRTKDNILWLVMDGIYGQLEDQLEAERTEASGPTEALLHALSRYLSAVDTVRRGILIMYREYKNLSPDAQTEFEERERRVINIFADIIKEGVNAGVFSCSHPDLASLDLLMAGHAWALKGWLLRQIPLETYIARQCEVARALVGVSD